MALLEKKEATPGQLKWFGLMFAAFFALLGSLSWWRSHAHATAVVFWTIGAICAGFYYALPPIRRAFYDLCIAVTYPIGWVVSHLVMIIMYYLVITPIGLAMRLCGRDPLDRTFNRNRSTCWVRHDPDGSAERYFHQF